MSKPSVPAANSAAKPRQRSLWPLWAALFVSLAPVVAAVALYFNPQWMPSGRTNYGTLLDPQVSVPPPEQLRLTTLDGTPFDLQGERGQWLLVMADGGECDEACAKKLFIMRQTHASTGKNVVRIERVWFITDDAPVSDVVQEAYKGTHFLRVQEPAQLQSFLGQGELERHIWIIDPLNNLMMQFPEDPDTSRLRKDLGRLLFASQVG